MRRVPQLSHRLTMPFGILKGVLNRSTLLDQTFQALADPARRAMLERLSRGPASVSDIARPLAMSLPAVMQHLAVLESSGLVRSEKTGRVRRCRLNAAALSQAERWIQQRRIEGEGRFGQLGPNPEALEEGEAGE